MSSLPSGIRLMNLLRDHLTEIMDRERANLNSIHLYCTGSYWVSFERSAYQLRRVFPDSETTPLRLFAYPFPIVMVSVTDRSLRLYDLEEGRDGLQAIDRPRASHGGLPCMARWRGGRLAPADMNSKYEALEK